MQENSRPKNRPSLKNPRTRAFHAQGGRCYYCGEPMWNHNPHELTARYAKPEPQVKKYRCTGEHLITHSNGGSAKDTNIVAACLRCNQGRHRRKNVLAPDDFKEFVEERMSRGKWHAPHLAC